MMCTRSTLDPEETSKFETYGKYVLPVSRLRLRSEAFLKNTHSNTLQLVVGSKFRSCKSVASNESL